MNPQHGGAIVLLLSVFYTLFIIGHAQSESNMGNIGSLLGGKAV